MSTMNKNNMPSFAQGSYNNIVRLINDKKINAPAFVFFTDKECLGFLDGKSQLHVILWDKINIIEEQLDGLKDPDTGEVISVKEYVQPTIDAVDEIQKNGATILITTDGGDD